jgi:hypothetical protein
MYWHILALRHALAGKKGRKRKPLGDSLCDALLVSLLTLSYIFF